MMAKKGCYIDGDPHTGAGGSVADSQDTDDKNPSGDDREGEPGDKDSDDPDQRRTSKQAPEVDAAYAEARRAREAAEKAQREADVYKAQLAAKTAAEMQQKEAATNQNEDANFEASLRQEVAHLRAEGLHESVIEARVDALQAKYDNYKIRRELAQEKEQRKREKTQEQMERQREAQQRSNEKVYGHWFDQFKDLRKDYPDLLGKKATTFDEVAQAYPKVIECMIKENLDFKRAFKEIYEDEVAERRYKRKQEKDRDNADRSTSSGKERGDVAGGTHGLTERQQKLAKDGGMTNKEYAGLLKHVKK
jgi:hypothetical protein